MNYQPFVSVVMPVYNTATYVADAVSSVLFQSYENFELLIIDDAGHDNSIEICETFDDPRIRIIKQANRGLAGARNTGIRNARGSLIAFLDSDDLWMPRKLERHVQHFALNETLGVSYSGSVLIDDDGVPLSVRMTPKLDNIRAEDVFLRNPIGNGSAPVIRRDVFDDIRFEGRPGEHNWFDETFRQSEDIECWLRIILNTRWKFEGIEGYLTVYRINESGLSANIRKQYESWIRVRDKVCSYARGFGRMWSGRAEGYQLRYLARRAVRTTDAWLAIQLLTKALVKHPLMVVEEPRKTASTAVATVLLLCFPRALNRSLHQRYLGRSVPT
ncbi:MAG: glycosyltransferase family 2 protein [Pseudomonadota bacterium]